jgi:hypothetical protein
MSWMSGMLVGHTSFENRVIIYVPSSNSEALRIGRPSRVRWARLFTVNMQIASQYLQKLVAIVRLVEQSDENEQIPHAATWAEVIGSGIYYLTIQPCQSALHD